MLQRRGIIGLIFGVGALALGIVTWAGPHTDKKLALVAGLLGLGAGAFALFGELQRAHDEALIERHRRDAADAEARVTNAEEAVAHERKMRATAEDEVNRLTSALDAAERSAPVAGTAPVAGEGGDLGRSLTDPETKLFCEAYFRVALDSRIASARRHLRPVAIGLLDVIEGVTSEAPHRADPVAITASIRQTLRDADTACRLSDGSYALILEDTPENGAVWTVERVRRALTAQFPDITLWAGVACYPAHAFSSDELIDASRLALAMAREWKQDRIEVATVD